MTRHDDLDLSRAPLLAHLLELRRRLLICLALFAVAFGVSYLFADPLYRFLMQPLVDIVGVSSGRRMIFTGLHEAFLTQLKLAFVSALFFTLPLALIQVWKFIAPGLYQHERNYLRILFGLTPILFVTGAALAYYVVFPLAWEFFLSFEAPAMAGSLPVELEARVSEYLGLVIRLILAFGLAFELPVVLLLLARTGAVTADSLARNRRYAIVAIFATAALITPPDLISQIALGTPVWLLYEFSVVLIRLLDRQTANRPRATTY